MATKSTVAFVIDDGLDSSDGVQQYVKSLGEWFESNGWKVAYFAGETKTSVLNKGKVYSLSKNVKVAFNANKLSIPLPADSKKIKSALKAEKPDILHIQMPHSPFMAQKVVDLAPASTGVIGTFHILPVGSFQKIGSKLLSLWYGKKLKRFDNFLAVSLPAKKFAKDTFKIDCQVLPNVVALSKYKNEIKPIKNRIVFLGRLVERKGAEHLIRAFAILINKIPDAELIIAGDGHQSTKLKKLAKDLGIADKIKFLGFIDEADKPKLLGSASIACFPALYGESFGIVLIEAMAAGSRVVLGGNNPGYSSVLGQKPELLFEPTDHQTLADKLDYYLSDEASAGQIDAWQQSHIKQFDVKKVGPQLENIYRTVVKSHPG